MDTVRAVWCRITDVLLAALIFQCVPVSLAVAAPDMKNTNIVYILADDLGIGDVRAFNPNSRIRTPNLDQLASEGMRFTDAHSGSSVCTPTRYGVLTGRYAWRTRLQSGVCWGYSVPLIAEDRMTVASMLKRQGYNTACVGKWHLGLKWALKDPARVPTDHSGESWENIDFAQPIASGPVQLGFDRFFGISASLDMHPHVYIRNDRVTRTPDRVIPASDGIRFWRKGPVGDDFRHVEVLDRLTDEAVEFIGSQDSDRPFFLYFPLSAPHKPIIPDSRFLNRSGLNEWGDFVMQVDATVGRVMQAVKTAGLDENTLFIVTSDNGATPGADFATLEKKGHDPSYLYRGHKADIFEGGHRVAFLARWPAVIRPGTESGMTVCHTDLLATAAEMAGVRLPAAAGEDSVSMLPLLTGSGDGPVREATVHHSVNGSFAIRRGRWKLCFCPGSGGWSHPRPSRARQDKLPAVQLFDLSKDVAESENLSADYPEVVSELSALMQRYIDRGRSTPGVSQNNDRQVQFPWKQPG